MTSINHPLKILLFTNGLILFSAAMLGPIYALFVDEIGGDLLDASLAGATFSLTAAIVVFIFGKLSDSVRENELLVVLGYALMGTGFCLYTVVDSMSMLLFVQVVIGIGEAMYSPSFDALYSKHLNEGQSGTQWGTWESLNYSAAASGAFIGGTVATAFGFHALFLAMAALAFFSATFILALKRSTL